MARFEGYDLFLGVIRCRLLQITADYCRLVQMESGDWRWLGSANCEAFVTGLRLDPERFGGLFSLHGVRRLHHLLFLGILRIVNSLTDAITQLL